MNNSASFQLMETISFLKKGVGEHVNGIRTANNKKLTGGKKEEKKTSGSGVKRLKTI